MQRQDIVPTIFLGYLTGIALCPTVAFVYGFISEFIKSDDPLSVDDVMTSTIQGALKVPSAMMVGALSPLIIIGMPFWVMYRIGNIKVSVK